MAMQQQRRWQGMHQQLDLANILSGCHVISACSSMLTQTEPAVKNASVPVAASRKSTGFLLLAFSLA
jgi:hypothetical protein